VTVFQDAGYRRLWASGLCFNITRWMDLVAVGWLALQLTGSPFMVGIAAFARSAPMMVLGPIAGIVTDRVSRGRLIVLTQAIGSATSVTLALLFATGHGGYWPLVVVELIFGVLWTLDFPARRTMLFSMLGASRVAQAVSLETVSMQIAKMVGPLAAGACLAQLGPTACYVVMAIAATSGVIVSRGLQHSGVGAPPPEPSAGRPALVTTLAEGLRAAWNNQIARAVLLITIAINMLLFPYQHMLSVFAKDVLAGGPGTLGALVAADGVGSLLGALAIAAAHGRLRHAPLFGAAVTIAPIVLIAFAASRSLALCLVLMFAMGVVESGFAAMQSTLVLLSAPPHARGGAMGILSACIGTGPVGTLALGAMVGSIGAPPAFVVNATAALLVMAPLALPLIRRR
jgi:MFS family permease